MNLLTKGQRVVMSMFARGISLGAKVDEIITAVNVGITGRATINAILARDVAINTSTPTGESPTVTLVVGASATQIVAGDATVGVTLLLPDLAESDGRIFTVINDSGVDVTVKGKGTDTGIVVVTAKVAQFLVLSDNTVKRLTADI